MDAFTKFEHEGWQRVADKYDSTWSSSTRQFIPPLLDAAEVSGKMSILDVGCGPGYVSATAAERGAIPIGLDFSEEMIAIAKKKFPRIEWNVPTARFVFDAELNAGVRTAGVLARQTPEVLRKIQAAIEKAVQPYAKGAGFAIP